MTSSNTAIRNASNEATILIVDDIASQLQLLRETLEPCGYGVVRADGETALKLATQTRPD